MFPILIKIKELVLDLLFPPVCLVCRRRLTRCETERNFPEARLEERAGMVSRPQSGRASDESQRASTLGERAVAKENSFPFLCCSCSQKIQINTSIDKKTGLAAAVSYSDEVPRQLIFLLKYQKIKTAAVPLAEILTQYLIKNLKLSPYGRPPEGRDIRNFSIVPVPLHWYREKKRGFNQSYLIARQLSKNTGLPVLKNALKRIRNTPSQVELKEKKKREMNVYGCFVAEKPELLFQKNIILLDDVSTSGATMKEAMKVIKNSGAAKIIGLVVAKV